MVHSALFYYCFSNARLALEGLNPTNFAIRLLRMTMVIHGASREPHELARKEVEREGGRRSHEAMTQSQKERARFACICVSAYASASASANIHYTFILS